MSYIYIYIYRRSNHMTCRSDRLSPPTWLRSGLISDGFRTASITPTKTGLTWPSWPLWLACPRTLWAARAWLLCPSSSNLVAQTGKSSNSTREGHQNLKISFFLTNRQKYHPQPPKWRANCAQGIPSRPFRAPMCPQRHPRAAILATFSQHLAWLEPWSFKVASGIQTWSQNDPPGTPKSSKSYGNCPRNLRKSVSATGPEHTRLVRPTWLYDD